MTGPPCACGCGQPTSGKVNTRTREPVRYLAGHGNAENRRKYQSDEERRAAHTKRQREYMAQKRREAGVLKRASGQPKPSDPDPSGARCVECGKRLTVAAVWGESEHCSRECAGLVHGSTTLDVEEPSADELEAVA